MNFTEAVAEVLATVKRPDKITTIRRKVNGAISFYSLDSEFSRDFYEQAVAVSATEITQSFSLSDLTRFRRFKYIKLGGTKKYLTPLADSEMFKDCNQTGRYYIAGDTVNLWQQAYASSLDIGYFQYPPLLTDASNNRTFWMLDMAPYMIIDKAAAEVFRDIGDEKSMQAHLITARDSYLSFRKDQGISTQ